MPRSPEQTTNEHKPSDSTNPELVKPERILIDFINQLSKTRKEMKEINREFMAKMPESLLAELPDPFNDPNVYALGVAIDSLVAFGKKAGYIDKKVDSRDYY